jgi:hypothetical protein
VGIKRVAWITFAMALVALVAGCGGNSERDHARQEAKENQKHFVPYIPKNGVEGANYNKAQELYDDPATIIWCTAFPQSSTEPLITVPVAGKLTSSTVSAFRSEDEIDGVALEAESVDGLYHGTPPPYRYGFTPGGQYVDFFNLPTLCTTQPLKFQRQSVSVSVDSDLNKATEEAESALKAGNKKQAQAILAGAAG